jgi:hypothetical protein
MPTLPLLIPPNTGEHQAGVVRYAKSTYRNGYHHSCCRITVALVRENTLGSLAW